MSQAPRSRLRWRLSVLLLVVLSAVLFAAAAHESVAGGVSLRLERIGVEQGLSQATARALAQDGDGMVWIGTQDGLNRYDGYAVRVFRHDPEDPSSLADNHVTALATDAKGRLWVGTQAGGLGVYDPDRQAFRNFPVAPGRADAVAAVQVSAIQPVADGSLWIASGRGQLQRLEPDRGVFSRIVLPADTMVRTLLAMPGGDVLIGSNAGVWRWRAATGQVHPWGSAGATGADVPDVQSLALGKDGVVWVGSVAHGVYAYAADGGLLRRVTRDGGLAGDDVRALMVDAGGRVWIGTYTGLSRIDASNAVPKRWSADEVRGDGLASERVHALMQDRDGLVWIGSWLGGVHLFLPRTEAFHEYRAVPGNPEALPGNGVRRIFKDDDGSLWLGVQEGGGLVRFTPDVGVADRYFPAGGSGRHLPSDRIQAIARDLDGSLWVGFVDAGLARLRPGQRAFEQLSQDPADPSSPRGANVMALLVDRAGTLWVGYQEQGMDALCRTCEQFTRFSFDASGKAGLPGRNISVVFEDRAGAIWVGALPGGLAQLDRASGTFRPLAELLESNGQPAPRTVTTITQARNGELWVGTQGEGLFRLQPIGSGRYRSTNYNHKHGLAAEAIGRIIEDAAGSLWVSTTLGISRLEPGTGRIENYGARSGAQTQGYFVDSGVVLDDGRIVFGGLRGLTIFNPAEVLPHGGMHRPAVTDVRTFQGGSTDASAWRYSNLGGNPDRLWLSAGSGGFGATFSALAFTEPALVQYSYRLDPIDKDWIESDASLRSAGYPHLSPGDYTLRVRARFPGEDYGPERRIEVRLDPLWWQSSWARALFAALVVLPFLLWGWNRRQRGIERDRTQAALAESEERLQLALWGTGDEFWDADLRSGELVRVNPLPHIRFEHQEPELTFPVLLDHIHDEDRAAITAALDRHVRGDEAEFDSAYRLRDQQGDWRWVRSRGRTVERGADGRPVRMAGVTEDITELREHARMLERVNQQLEDRVEQRTSDLTRVNRELTNTIDELRLTQHQLVESEKLAALGGLVAGIAHEVNTPLGVGVTAASHLEQQARSFANALEAGDVTRERASSFSQVVSDASAMVLRNLQRADRMVRSFKQVAVDQASEQPRLLLLASYLDEIRTSLQPVLKRSPHRLLIDVPEGFAVTTQPGAIYQVVVNLVTNSLTHAFEGNVQGTMRLAVWAEGEGWVLEYTDDGVGMTEEVRRRLYDPFFTTRRGQGGSGLGMHIVYNLAVQTLAGSIECESSPGQGVRFTLHIPSR